MLVELAVAEQRLRAVLEVLDGASVTEVARRFGVSRQTVHVWLRRYAGDGGFGNLADRSTRPRSCPHQMPAAVEARVLVLRDGHPSWGPDRIRWQLGQEGVVPVPGRSSIYRALVRNGRIDPRARRRRRSEFRRWQRGRPMELWQMDVVGGIHLADGVEAPVIPESLVGPGAGCPNTAGSKHSTCMRTRTSSAADERARVGDSSPADDVPKVRGWQPSSGVVLDGSACDWWR